MDQNISDFFSQLTLSNATPSSSYPRLLPNFSTDGLTMGAQAQEEIYGPIGPVRASWASAAGLDSSCLGSKEDQLDHLRMCDLRGRIVALARDHDGVRFLQKKLEGPQKEEDIEVVLGEVIERIGELMKDQFANYFMQRLVKVCSDRQRTKIVLALSNKKFLLIGLSLHPHGTRVVQKLLECVTSKQQVSLLISALSPGSVVLSVDPNGHHVIQHCLIRFSDQDNMQLITAISQNTYKIATSKSGCCVLQSCVEHCRGEYRERILSDIINNAFVLAQDPYGNYVVQHLLGLKIPEITENILRELKGNFLPLSCNKFASNVVEKCLTLSSTEKSSQVIIELLASPNVSFLLVDPYGNFVIQSALVVSQGFLRNALLTLVQVNTPVLRSNHYGKRVLDRLDKMALPYI